MSKNFSFMPMGLSTAMTIGGAAPATISLVLQGVGQTVTQQIGSSTAANYVPSAVRLTNLGTAVTFINFGATAAAVSTSPVIGTPILNGASTVLRTGGNPFLAATCASTFTVTLSVTPGEGMN